MLYLTHVEAMYLTRLINTCIENQEITLTSDHVRDRVLPLWSSAQLFIEAGLRQYPGVSWPVEVQLDDTTLESLVPIVRGWHETLEQKSHEWATACVIQRRIESALN